MRLSKKGFALFDKRIAVCRVHDLYAFGVQIAQLRAKSRLRAAKSARLFDTLSRPSRILRKGRLFMDGS